MIVDGDKRPKLGDLSIGELEAIIAEHEASKQALQEDTDRLIVESQPLRDQIATLTRQLNPYQRAILRNNDRTSGIEFQTATVRGRIHQLQEAAQKRRMRELRLAGARRAINALNDTALRLSETIDQDTSSLGRILGRVLSSEEARLALPDLIEENLSQHHNINNGSRVMVGNGRDSVRLMLLLDGQAVVGYHPKTVEQRNTLGDILSQVTAPSGYKLDGHFIGFRADPENGVLVPFALAKKREYTRYGTYVSESVPVELPQTDERISSMKERVGSILANGYASLRIDGRRVTLPPQ